MVNIHTHHPSGSSEEIISIELMDVSSNLNPSVTSFSVGVHPWKVDEYSLEEIENSLNNAIKKEHCVAIGETGLDRVHSASIKHQKESLKIHIQLAEQNNLPLILHSVKTHSDLLQLKNNNSTPWILHGFIGNKTQFNQLLRKGFHFSFGWQSLHHLKTIECFKQAPLSSIFLETDDCTFPIEDIYKTASTIRKLSTDYLTEHIRINYQSIFPK